MNKTTLHCRAKLVPLVSEQLQDLSPTPGRGGGPNCSFFSVTHLAVRAKLWHRRLAGGFHA